MDVKLVSITPDAEKTMDGTEKYVSQLLKEAEDAESNR